MQRKRKPLSQLFPDYQQQIEKRYRGEDDQIDKASQMRAGTIARIVVKNFMCHTHMEVDFKSNINFLIGNNGSGKSSIMTALIVGLGGKAALTSRGNNVKGFIKSGESFASVEIILNNQGWMSYKFDDFGDKITIMRNFTSSGTSNYKIKSSTGEIISSQLKDIQRICAYFNIQIDNPICLLNQDTARNFLNSKDPRQKFMLFTRATRLEAMHEEHEKMLHNQIEATRSMQPKERLYRELKNEINTLEQKMKDYDSISSLKEKSVVLQRELLWSKVKDAEAIQDLQKNVITRLNKEFLTMQDNMQKNESIFNGHEQSIRDLNQQIMDLQNSIEQENEPQTALVNALGRLKETINEKHREKCALIKEIARDTGNCNIMQSEITSVTENYNQIEEEKAKRLNEMQTTEGKIKGVQSLLETSQNDQYQLKNSINRLQEEEHSLLAEIRQIDSQINNASIRLSGFKENSNALLVYGREMPQIVEAINSNKNKFMHLPRGPLGSFITLKDKKWAVAVEGFLSPTLLRAFTVDNKSDNQLLIQIFEKVGREGPKPMVITGKFFLKVHDVSCNLVKPVKGCVSVYDSLEIRDPVVANCLIDQVGIESVLLIPDSKTAIELMSNEHNVPRNCRQGITIKGDRYYPDPNYKTYASRYNTAQYLQVSTVEIIRQLEEKLQNFEDKKITIRNQREGIQRDIFEQNKIANELDVKLGKLNKGLLLLRRKLNDLQNVDELDVANITVTKDQLIKLKKVVEDKKQIHRNIEADIDKLKRKIQVREEQLEQIKVIVRGYEDRIEPLNAQILENEAKCKEMEINKRFAHSRLKECIASIEVETTDFNKKTQNVEVTMQSARVHGDRPSILRPVSSLLKELNENNSVICKIESNMDNPKEIYEKHKICKDRYNKASQFMRDERENIKILQQETDRLGLYYVQTEHYFASFLQHAFQKVLEVRQFEGELNINAEEKKLDLFVIPGQRSQAFKKTSDLSGGERSFSTVAFLYSLWQCTEFPFYFLDEFDVFMDKVNRTKVMEILLYHAKRNSDLQFVFLTPQDMSFLSDKTVTVQKLANPERGNIE
ncbi:hypothetical protein FQA39_LY07861 [Lamprigera yunnana]|nr:hypothetical protein FQA39_LY07861 [Lamprigera yunnana]